MFISFFFALLSFNLHASKVVSLSDNTTTFIKSEKLTLKKKDHILAENLVKALKLIEKGSPTIDLFKNLDVETQSSRHFLIFNPMIKSVLNVSILKSTNDLIAFCRNFSTPKENLPIEKKLERVTGNYCREKTLASISKDIEKANMISDEAISFIQENLKFYLTKKNKKNFAIFIQSISDRPEILKRISQVVTSYSVLNEIVPSQEVLQDMEINEQITKLIQMKGFNPLQHQNVFYAEFGKLIEQSYKAINVKEDEKVDLSKITELFTFLKNYIELNQDHLPLGLCLSRLNDLSKSVYRSGLTELSRSIFQYIIKKNDKSILQDTLFSYLWTYIRSEDYEGASNFIDKYRILSNKAENTDPRLKFWVAHTLEKLEKKKQATQIYDEIIISNPLSFYAIMSAKRLHQLNPNSSGVVFYSKNSHSKEENFIIDTNDIDDDNLSSLIRLKAWSKINHAKLLKLELKRLSRHSIPNLVVKYPTEKQLNVKSELHLLNAKIIQESNHLSTFKYLYEAFENRELLFNRSLLEILYPRPYFDDLVKVLGNNSLDPIIVLSLIRQESVFNPLARSPVGARGLMQLMPTTAKRIRRGVSLNQLNNPKINIEVGTKYFKNLLNRYDNNLVYVLSAYNAGESRVEKWKNLYWDTEASILKNIEEIPFLETRNYVKLIFRNIFFYKLLLQKNEISDEAKFNKIYDVSLGFKH
jgi:soluble lytic murein transglycosylase